MSKKEFLLQRFGVVETKAYINGGSLVIAQETPSGRFDGVSLLINKSLLKNLIELTKELQKRSEKSHE